MCCIKSYSCVAKMKIPILVSRLCFSLLCVYDRDIRIFCLFLKLTECYKAVSNWTDLLKWKEKEAELWMHQNGGTPQKYVSFSENS